MNTLQFYNTLTGKKEPLQTIEAKKVKMYCCGVTPYGNTHIGHARTFFSYDLLHRALKDNGYEVSWARNITDVDDKIIRKANEENVSCDVIVDRYVSEQNEYLDIFKLEHPEFEPKVTQTIPEIISHIQLLIDKGSAYVSTSGVYFRVKSFPAYGKLSGNKVDELRAGSRIEVDETKEDAVDFALWKFAKPGEIFWESPWGKGRPGWHIECSAMVHKVFGDSIDIHMGGRDLIFPHHECEIAQSEAATGKKFSTFWLYAGMATLDGEKMSKSLANYVSLKDFLEKYPAEVLRLIFLSSSYSATLDFSLEVATQNLKKLAKLYRFVALVDGYESLPQSDKQNTELVFSGMDSLVERMRLSIRDDLNTGAALATFFEFIKSVNSKLGTMEKKGLSLNISDKKMLSDYWAPFKNWCKSTLGLLLETPEEFFASLPKYKLTSEISAHEIDDKIKARNEARAAKEWKLSDEIRDELKSAGIEIQDTPNGTKWTVLL